MLVEEHRTGESFSSVVLVLLVTDVCPDWQNGAEAESEGGERPYLA